MKYYLDTEFIEGPQSKFFGLIKTKPTIDLISIGIVAEDGREYYAISKDFNLKEAWNRCDIKDLGIDGIQKTYWIRENVLRPIYDEFVEKHIGYFEYIEDVWPFEYEIMRSVINHVGKSNKIIAEEVKEFVGTKETILNWDEVKDQMNPQFYGYYCDYDWVVFCWLFGYMKDLPAGFPMYCRDLKQMLDDKIDLTQAAIAYMTPDHFNGYTDANAYIKNLPDYPKQSNEHSAIDDARWNKELHQFIQSL